MIKNLPFDNEYFNNLSRIINRTSDEKFNFITEVIPNRKHYPEEMKLAVMTDIDHSPIEIVNASRNLVEKYSIEDKIFCTLACYYPKDGFIGWHDNDNFSFYNAICTYSNDGKSFFEYKNESNETVKIYDNIGWSVKMTKWGGDRPLSHRAVSNDKRITITFSSKDKYIIEDLINNF